MPTLPGQRKLKPRVKKETSQPVVPNRKRDPQAVLHAFHRFLTGEESDGEYRAYCPACEEPGRSSSPSASFNPGKGVWKCMGKCGGGGSINTLIVQLKQQTGFNYNAERLKGRSADPKSDKHKPIPDGEPHPDLLPAAIEAAHKRLLNSTVALDRLMDERGLSRQTVERFKIGWDGERYRIPVKDAAGDYVNIRRYKLKAEAKQKMYNLKGCGSGSMMYPMEALNNDVVVLCEGEMDALLLNQHGIPAVTGTHGAATFKPDLAPLFSGKQVYICYDNDDTGRVGARKAAKMIGSFTEHVYVVNIPLPSNGADVTDFLYMESNTADDFRALMEGAQAARPAVFSETTSFKALPSSGQRVSLEESLSGKQDVPLEMMVAVAGKQNPPYVIPKRFTVTCSMTKGPACKVCPVAFREGQMTHEYAADDVGLFEYIGSSAETSQKVMKKACGARCTDHSQWDVEERYIVEELIVGNSVEDRVQGEDQRPVNRTIYSVGTHKTPVNTVVRLVGANTTSHKDNRLSFIAWSNEPVQTSLDKFSMTEEEMFELTIFQPREEQSALERALEIANDFSRNVTQIYGRDLLHVAYDLVWHSPLSFRVEGRMMEKGWLEMMVVGDTRTGKSETAMRLAEHYKAGVVKSCEGATFAGLVGGAQQIGSNWVTTWGAIPLNDRRLVVLDEVSGLKDRDVIENMSSIRSSGKAQITKIISEETSARTRLIWITNPADGTMLDEKPDVGVDALKTVVKANEDIARFDFVAAAREGDVKANTINKVHKPKPTVFTSKLSERLVLWAWSLKPEDITFTPAAEAKAREIANKVAGEYIPDPPLIQAANVRWKLYRIAAALAIRTFSVRWHKQENECEVVVYKEHIEDAYAFLNMLYDSPGMQYRRMSQRKLAAAETARQKRDAAKMYLIEHSDSVMHALRVVGGSTFRVRDFSEFGAMDSAGAQAAVKQLTNFGMLHNKSRGDIRMDQSLVGLLRELEDEGY